MVKNITLSAEEAHIQAARERASRERTSFNQVFRRWLAQYAEPSGAGERFDRLMKDLSHIEAGGRFSRDEMNER